MRLTFSAALLAALVFLCGLAWSADDLNIMRDQFIGRLIELGLKPTFADFPDYEGLTVTSATVNEPHMTFSLFSKPDGSLVEVDSMISARQGGEMVKGGVIVFLMESIFPDWDTGVDWVKNALDSQAPSNSIKRDGIRIQIDRSPNGGFVHLVITVPE